MRDPLFRSSSGRLRSPPAAPIAPPPYQGGRHRRLEQRLRAQGLDPLPTHCPTCDGLVTIETCTVARPGHPAVTQTVRRCHQADPERRPCPPRREETTTTMPYTCTCQRCGKTFESRFRKTKACSNACSQALSRARRKQRQAPTPPAKQPATPPPAAPTTTDDDLLPVFARDALVVFARFIRLPSWARRAVLRLVREYEASRTEGRPA